jgi:hypothetical protein
MSYYRPIAICLATLWAAPVLSGCSGPEDARDAGESVRSLVRVDLSYTRSLQAEPRFDAQAHFVRYTAPGSPAGADRVDRAGVPTLLGLDDFDAIPVDTCRLSDGTAALDQALSYPTLAGAPTEVSLLDAGRLEVRGPADRSALLPHHYPELVPFVSGVVYGGDELAPLALSLGQTYQVVGEGGEEVGPFTASATAPRAFPTVSVEPLRRGSDLDIRWADAAALQGSGALAPLEPLLLEVRWSGRAGSRSVQCRVRDDGGFVVPKDALASLPTAGQLASASVTATRVQRGPLTAPGIGAGELTFSLRDQAPLQVAP